MLRVAERAQSPATGVTHIELRGPAAQITQESNWNLAPAIQRGRISGQVHDSFRRVVPTVANGWQCACHTLRYAGEGASSHCGRGAMRFLKNNWASVASAPSGLGQAARARTI
jgi:hypothetical protein